MDSTPTKLRKLTPTRCWELLAEQDTGRLAVSIANHPDIFPVNYKVLDKTIVIRTDEGDVLSHALESSSVAFEVDALRRSARTGWSVVVKGTAHEPKQMEDYLGAVELGIAPWPGGTKDRFLIISPTGISGRVIPPTSSTVVLIDPDSQD